VRHEILLRSVQPFLRRGETLMDAGYMWTRHRYAYPYMIAVFVVVVGLAAVFGFDTWLARVALGAAAAAMATTATTDYWVLVQTDSRMFLCRASTFRQVAKEFARNVEHPVIEPVGGTMLATDWSVDGVVYTVAKSSEQAVQSMAAQAFG